MSDLIDRQAAIDALDEQIRQCDKALSAFDISMKDEYAVKVERASLVAFRETLEYMSSAQPGWIPWDKNTRNSMKYTLQTLYRLAYNIHGVMDAIDDDNVKRLIALLEGGQDE